MMKAQHASETSDYYSIFTRLAAREDFIAFQGYLRIFRLYSYSNLLFCIPLFSSISLPYLFLPILIPHIVFSVNLHHFSIFFSSYSSLPRPGCSRLLPFCFSFHPYRPPPPNFDLVRPSPISLSAFLRGAYTSPWRWGQCLWNVNLDETTRRSIPEDQTSSLTCDVR
jgi:hypothetical protein